MLPIYFRSLLMMLMILSAGRVIAQPPDSPALNRPDSSAWMALPVTSPDSLATAAPRPATKGWQELVGLNESLNTRSAPVYRIQEKKATDSRDAAFYILAILLLALGLLKLAFARYFGNLQRVFFNTSLRQSQLTDQLLQAKLPSLLFNLFFIFIGGYYVFLLMVIYGKTSFSHWPWILPGCILALMVIYLVKYWVLKFAGWITGYRTQTETYIFIVFLVNKMIALVLVPLVIIMSFSQPALVRIALNASYVIIAAMILMRFFRSYALLQPGLRVSRFHFFLYIIGVEVLPLLLIYQSATIFIDKNL